MRRLNKSLFLAVSIFVASFSLVGCSETAVIEETPESYEGEWHGCLTTEIGIWAKFEDGKYYSAFTVYSGSDCLTGGSYTSLTSDADDDVVTEIQHIGDITTKSVTGVPTGYTFGEIIYVAGLGTTVGVGHPLSGGAAGTKYDWLFYTDGTTLRALMVFGGNYAGANPNATHATWDEWQTETVISSFVADLTGYDGSSSGFFNVALTAGAPTAAL